MGVNKIIGIIGPNESSPKEAEGESEFFGIIEITNVSGGGG